MQIQNKVRRKRIDATTYVNTTTNKTLAEEVGDFNVTSINMVEGDLVKIDNKNYVTIDSNAVAYLETQFNDATIGKILKMCRMIDGVYNLLIDGNKIPHTKKTLGIALDYSRNKLTDFLNEMFKKSVLHYQIAWDENTQNTKVTRIILNPTIARKSRFIHQESVKPFKDLRHIKI